MSIVIGWGQLKPELSTDIKEVIIKCLEIDENKRITAFDLKKLNYFKIRNQSPTKTSSEAQFKEYKSIY
jgi:serine/threonine protein kinase